jgi:2-polyprenyl-6-methoxyphenol hydroxylase-like FAD-dependent oxidoreductase
MGWGLRTPTPHKRVSPISIAREQWSRERLACDAPMTRVVVAGGGIGGLVTALTLHQRGIEAVVLEQATRLEAVGAGIQISPNACYVLDKLDLLDALRSQAFEPRSIDITDGRRDRLLISVPLTPIAVHRYGESYLNVHRGDLHQVLVKALSDRSPDCVLLDSRVESIRQDDTGVEAILADGRHINGCPRRRRRARRVQATAARNGRFYHADSPGPRFVRDTTMRVLRLIGGSTFLARRSAWTDDGRTLVCAIGG